MEEKDSDIAENTSYIYIIKCRDGSYYTGITKDVKRRMNQHFLKKKQGAKYTKSRQAVWLEAVWKTKSWSEAGRMEYFIKSLTRQEKERLVKNPKKLSELYKKRKEKEPPMLEISEEFGNFPVFLEEWLKS